MDGPVRWLEVTVEAHVEAVEAVSEIFGRLGHGSAVRPTRLLHDPHDESVAREDPSAPYEVTAHLPDDAAASEALDLTRRALWHLQAFGLGPVSELAVRGVDDTDWSEAWKAGYVPQRIGRLVIVPSWLDDELRPGELALRLDPGMAFGTGLHPTTRGCLTLLQRCGPMPERVLDVGSGSGILALAAVRLGAGQVDCLDTDPVAVSTTLANAAANGLDERLTATEGTLPVVANVEPYPLILANLVAGILVDLAASLAAHLAPGGTLIAGGIIAERASGVVAALEGQGLATSERLDDEDWVSLRVVRQ